MSVSQAARDSYLYETVLRQWVRELATHPHHAFPGQGQMKPEQAEIERLKKEVVDSTGRRNTLIMEVFTGRPAA